MRFERSVEIAVPAEQAYAVYADVERWPEWTASVESVERLDEGPLRVGSSAKVKQPRLPGQEWVVTAVDEGRSFAWETRGIGIVSLGIHEVEPTPSGCRATAIVEMTGWMAPVAGRAARGLIDSYLELETDGLKRRCEGS
jgi:uncharacterized membrane protein